MTYLFAITLFLGSALLFVVEPMIGRLVLPLLGGTYGVWNTCMVFFQAALLAGYAYAHAAPARIGVRRHALVHVLLLVLPWFVLPIGIPTGWSDPGDAAPVRWLLGLLFLMVGLPFFVLSTTAPLLQRWLAATRDREAGDPYFLYAASNLGSLLALLGYPFVVEPLLPLSEQGRLWSIAYGAWVVLMLVCVVCLWRRASPELQRQESDEPEAEAPSLRRKLRWVLLSAVPSGLLISVTTYISADLGSRPLLWVVPLSLYLLTFVLAFSRRQIVPPKLLSRWLPLVVVVLVVAMLSEATEPAVVLIVLHLSGLFWMALFCHTELARDRPPAQYLTAFYLQLSAGGVLGGLFTALLAPVLFSSVVEYPLLMVAACLLRPTPDKSTNRKDVLLPAALGAATALLIVVLQAVGMKPGPISLASMFAAPILICYTFLERPLRFGLGIAGLLLAGSLYQGIYGRTEARIRSFFGVHRVTVDETTGFRKLVHGNTVHGMQSIDPEKARSPTSYYHPSGPAGQVFRALAKDNRLRNVGLLGLGAGGLTCYAEAGQEWTYFEIDPAVIYLARDSGWFTFLRDSPAPVKIVEGDGRLTLARSEEKFDLLIVDVFSSDAIPVHLMTREALAIYRNHLTPDGLILVNISNRFLNLAPILAALARDADPALVAFHQEDLAVSDKERAEGKFASQWLVLAPSREAAARVLRGYGAWQNARPFDGPSWSDDYSNPLGALKGRTD
jgi:spermidine synthase